MFYEPLIIIHVEKGLPKSYTVVQKQSSTITKMGVAHEYQSFIKTLGVKFQCR